MRSAAPVAIMQRTRRRAAPSSAILSLQTVGAILLAFAISIESFAQANSVENGTFEELLESTTAKLAHTSDQFATLQTKRDTKLADIERLHHSIHAEINSGSSNTAPALDQVYDDMDVIGTKVAELMRRTEGVLGRVGGYNRKVLFGQVGDGSDDVTNPSVGSGLEKRLERVLTEELQRRDRYNASMIEAGISVAEASSEDEEDINATESEVVIAHDNDANLPSNNAASDSTITPPSTYMPLTELNELLSPKSIISSSEKIMKQSLSNLANELAQQQFSSNDAMWNDRLAQIPPTYEMAHEALESEMQKFQQGSNQCLAIPQAAEIVGTALQEHYYDGTNLVDVARYETGATVVYEMTSHSYVPPPRNNAQTEGTGSDKRAAYEYEKQKMFDEQTEEMYHQQQAMMNQDANGDVSIQKKLLGMMGNLNAWEWYTSFQFESFRPYLPEDWERGLDSLSDYLGRGPLWSEHTPRGAMDALIPDYVYHSLGVANDVHFGTVFGRTASPEVAISAGYSKSRGDASAASTVADGGWTAKPMGHCYPLSMRSEDDPALGLMGELDYDIDANIIVGPKYTVRLPYAVHIDAVTLEHRSFPLSKGGLEQGWKGGESAPRWVRVVGYSPCPEEEEIREDEGFEEDSCSVRGFDISHPIDLGSFEYQRITVTGREDDYGGSDDDSDEEEEGGNDAFLGERRRSIQTFAVTGGVWKPFSLIGDDAHNISNQVKEYDSREPRKCSQESSSCEAPPLVKSEPESVPAAGQCAPPKDEDSEPSCGGDGTTSSGAQRQVVEAVSFIIEENWGNSDFTCLYRVRVHGDIVPE